MSQIWLCIVIGFGCIIKAAVWPGTEVGDAELRVSALVLFCTTMVLIALRRKHP